jgi:hypothetical protein
MPLFPLYQISRKNEGYLCLVVGLIAVLIGLINCLSLTIFLTNAVAVKGKVVSVDYVKGNKNPYEINIKFTPQNSLEQTCTFESNKSYMVGNSFDILYNPKNLDDVRAAFITNEYITLISIFILGCWLLLMGWPRVKYGQKLFGIF